MPARPARPKRPAKGDWASNAACPPTMPLTLRSVGRGPPGRFRASRADARASAPGEQKGPRPARAPASEAPPRPGCRAGARRPAIPLRYACSFLLGGQIGPHDRRPAKPTAGDQRRVRRAVQLQRDHGVAAHRAAKHPHGGNVEVGRGQLAADAGDHAGRIMMGDDQRVFVAGEAGLQPVDGVDHDFSAAHGRSLHLDGAAHRRRQRPE